MIPFLFKLSPKKPFLRGFTNFFFRTLGLQHKLLIWIVSPNIFHWKSAKKSKVAVVFGVQCCEKNKETGISMGFFHILHEVYIYKQKGSRYINTWVKIED